MTEHSNAIITIFLEKQTLSLKDSEISIALVAKGIRCPVGEVRHEVQNLSPGIFKIPPDDSTDSSTIRVDPQIEICGLFFSNRCHNNVRPCPRLHICRDFGHCQKDGCRYPHDLTGPINRQIIKTHHCERVDPQLLVQIIRLKRSLSNVNRRRSYPRLDSARSNALPASSASIPPLLTQTPSSKLTVDLSYPALDSAEQLDIEIIEMLIGMENIKITRRVDESETKYFRCATLQLDSIEDVEKLLKKSVLVHSGVEIKFKPSNSKPDQFTFLLKTPIDRSQEKIIEVKIKLYAAMLTGNTELTTLDLSTNTEQIIFVESKTSLEFDKIRQRHRDKPQLQNKDLALVEVCEVDTVTISYIGTKRVLTYEDLQEILASAGNDVFMFDLQSDTSARVEFISGDARRRWMSSVELIKSKFHMTVVPMIVDVDDNGKDDEETNIPFYIQSSVEPKPASTNLTLRPEWTFILSHDGFQREFREYIQEQLGGSVEIRGDEVIFTGRILPQPKCPTPVSVLANRTNNFMQKFRVRNFHDLKRYHIDILEAEAPNIVFKFLHRGTYQVAAKHPKIAELEHRLFPKNSPRAPNNPVPEFGNSKETQKPPFWRSSNPSLDTAHIKPPASNISTTSYPITAAEQINMFSLKRFEDHLQQYLVETFHLTVTIDHKGEKSSIIINLSGNQTDTDRAFHDLVTLFSLLRVHRYDDKNHGNWTKMIEAVAVIQYHFDRQDLLCSCFKPSANTVQISHFDASNTLFGVDERKITEIIDDMFCSATANYNKQSSSSKFVENWNSLEETIRQSDDYKKNICLLKQDNSTYLFGLKKLVKEHHQAFEQLKSKHNPQAFSVKLSEQQLNYLAHVAKQDFAKLEKQFKSEGCDLSLTRLKQNGQISAPAEMQSKITDNLLALVQLEESKFTIKSSPFALLIEKDPKVLLNIVKLKCYLEKKIRTHRVPISIPTAKAPDFDEMAPETRQPAKKTDKSSLQIGSSTITVVSGDLTKQTVDMIVVSSTSEILRNAIISAAGPEVQAQCDARKQDYSTGFMTKNGILPCKKILFLPFAVQQANSATLASALNTFVLTAIHLAITHNFTSLAFPSIGCGKFGFDPSIVAKALIDAASEQLTNNDKTVNVSFVITADQQTTYDAFNRYLNSLTSDVPETTVAFSRQDDRSYLTYNEKIVEITLISAAPSHLMKCKNEIVELANSIVTKKVLEDKQHLTDWSQKTTMKYYKYCLDLDVRPTIDFDELRLTLEGAKEPVNKAENYFYELTTETFKQARIHAVSRGVIWSFETKPGSDSWEQYSYKLNGLIEDAHSKKMTHIDFTNDKREKCRVNFSTMEEAQEETKRRIRRKEVDSLLPDTWEPQDQNLKRVVLPYTSPEYQKVLQKFNITMQSQYHQIVKIERIQNERWFKQYAAHRDEYKKRQAKLDERSLFHGCQNDSADKIMRECFNRSFAGVNGVVYGCGVYFHVDAQYSHTYAKPGPSGDRTMFLASVLIGASCKGNQSMKVPPAGYDTTTDGGGIFVIYHDAAAYADYLITYR